MLGVNHSLSPTALARANNRRSKRPSGQRALTRKVIEAIRALIEDGCNLKQAAEAAGLTYRSLYDAFRKPEVLAYFKAEMDVFRRGACAGNIRVALDIRDDTELKATAAGQKVRLEAIKVLEDDPDQRSHGVHINVGVAVQNMPGYQVRSGSDPALIARALAHAGSVSVVGADAIEGQLHRLTADEPKPLIEHEPMSTPRKE